MDYVEQRRNKEAQFIKTARDCYLYQHLLEPIQSQRTDNSSLIDLVLIDKVMQVSGIEYDALLNKSDHCVIIFKCDCYLDYYQPKERYISTIKLTLIR